MKEYIKLIRVKHYIKNFLIFAALLFSGQVFILEKLKNCVIGFAAFCFLSSVIYIFNDIKEAYIKYPYLRLFYRLCSQICF